MTCLKSSLEALKGGVRTAEFSPVFLLYLTAAWREVRAYPLLIEMLQLPEEDMDFRLSGLLRRISPDGAGPFHLGQ